MADLKQELASAGVQLVGARQTLTLIEEALDRAKVNHQDLTARWAQAEEEIRGFVTHRAAKLDDAEAAVRAAVEADPPPDSEEAANIAFLRSLARLSNAGADALDRVARKET